MATVVSSINYTAPLELYEREKPYYINVPAPDGRQSNQIGWQYDGVTFHDIRGRLGEFSLDRNGFEVFQYGQDAIGEDEATKFGSDSWIECEYYPVVEKVLKARFGTAIGVKIFDHTVRKRVRGAVDLGTPKNTKSLPAPRQPSFSAHCDQTALSGQNRVKFHMGGEAIGLLSGRCQIINVWRPLFGPLEDTPLTYCDWQTVNVARDYKAADLVFPHYIGEQYLVTWHPDHRWHYLSNQQSNEFTLLKCWDNKDDVARFVAHTSFVNPNTPEGARPRESVEFRCLVFGE